MLHEVLDYLRDLWAYAQVISTKRALRRGAGTADAARGFNLRAAREAVERLHPATMRLRVVRVIDETATTRTLRLARLDGVLPPFRPGQHVTVHVEIEGDRTSRPYSISSAPGADHLDLTVKVARGGFVSPYLAGLRPGDELTTSGPSGSFGYEPLLHGRDLVLVAAGSGITPFMSALRALAAGEEAARPRVHLLYGSRGDDVIFRRELEELAARSGWFQLSLVLSRDPPGWTGLRGRIDGELVVSQVAALEGRTFYVCGPEGLYRSVSASLLARGVGRHRLLRESYGPPADVTRASGWPTGLEGAATFDVEVDRHGTFEVIAGESLLTSFERNGLRLPATCRSGQCSSCRVRVLDGETFTAAGARVRQSDRDGGYVHACVTYPVSNLRVSR